MSQFKVPLLLLVAWLNVAPLMGQESDASKNREIMVPRVAGEPALILRISTAGRQGIVSVRTEGGAEVQSLVCRLLRDNAEATQQEVAAVREQFVMQFQAMDLDSDGYVDLAGIREFGAKWARYCVWLYDPRQHIFLKSFLAEQMELLTNLNRLEGGMVSSSQMSPTNPWQAVYRIAGAKESRPERQLVPVFSCLIETTPHGDNPTAVVMTRYDGGEAVVERQDAVKMGIKEALAKCASSESRAKK